MPPLWAGLAGVLAACCWSMRLPWHLRALGLPLLMPVLLWQAPRPAAGQFTELLAADIGQGNAVLVRTATRTLLYDAGPRYSPEQRRRPPRAGAAAACAGRAGGHAGAQPPRRRPHRRRSAVLASQPQAAALRDRSRPTMNAGLRPVQRVPAGQRWVWDGVVLRCCIRRADYDRRAAQCPTRPACCGSQRTHLPVGIGWHCWPVTSSSRRSRRWWHVGRQPVGRRAAGAAPRQQDVVQRRVSGCRAAALALVQAGYRNRFGHPAPEPMQRYARAASGGLIRPVAVRRMAVDRPFRCTATGGSTLTGTTAP
jgi:competence protein ComEC